MDNKLIVIEGACDGIGKTTQFELLKNVLNQETKVYSHHFPSYGTYHGAPVEKYLNGDFGSPKDLSPYFVNSLYANDRAIAWHTILKPKFEKGYNIILDRYTTSSIIYQSALIDDIEEKKKFIDFVEDFEYNKLGIRRPDHVIFLYAPFDVVTKLRKNRTNYDGNSNDVYERDIELMKKIYENALFVREYLNWEIVDCFYEDKLKGIYEINDMVYEIAKRK